MTEDTKAVVAFVLGIAWNIACIYALAVFLQM